MLIMYYMLIQIIRPSKIIGSPAAEIQVAHM
jgi:hypothetical protein